MIVRVIAILFLIGALLTGGYEVVQWIGSGQYAPLTAGELWYTIHRGSLNQSLVHPREVFACAVREAAAAIVVAHNHPSGDCSPSREDREVTRRLARAGEILGIRLLDHVVIADRNYTSFAEMGELVPQVSTDWHR